MSDTLLAEFPVRVTNLDKPLWPEAGITKADYIQYMIEMSPHLVRHLQDRPLTVVRFPHGIHEKSFYQKNAPKDTPEWVQTFAVYSKDSDRDIHYILANNTATLIWLANQACIELHPWYTKIQAPDSPTNIAIDLDPSAPGFEKVRKVAFAVKAVLDDLGFPSYPKTSGATGLQIFIPLKQGFTFRQTRVITEFIGRYLASQYPDLATVERLVKDREDKVYVDYLQHAPNKTLVSPYSPRPVPDAKVSAPLTWEELAAGAVPEDFTIRTMLERVKKVGDLFAPMEQSGVDITGVLHFIENHPLRTANIKNSEWR
ncbi:non-homologous end-joining DNA ligase [Effusibacillus lacus]|uniref:DNA polymerase n=1 Tax=Effusibacillus lacus TaxID=1348429 RepID=A0A292YLI2_9BACL|nr:non-homologous end-joining DNA ligase [Effusibacillus lacus]TCS75337.1 bifunctional non-homologous end joining protein LigD [Effusibacillus lacus]GAX89771.1 DNA polymerase [Effusibacillus lacus]